MSSWANLSAIWLSDKPVLHLPNSFNAHHRAGRNMLTHVTSTGTGSVMGLPRLHAETSNKLSFLQTAEDGVTYLALARTIQSFIKVTRNTTVLNRYLCLTHKTTFHFNPDHTRENDLTSKYTKRNNCYAALASYANFLFKHKSSKRARKRYIKIKYRLCRCTRYEVRNCG